MGPNDLFELKTKLLEKIEEKVAASVSNYQAKMFEVLLVEYLSRFEVVDGRIVSSKRNVKLLTEIDAVFDSLVEIMYRDVLGPLAKGMIEASELSIEYYKALGFEASKIKEVIKGIVAVRDMIGIDAKGVAKPGGYIHRVARTEEVRLRLQSFVINNVTSRAPFLEFQKGFKRLIKGSSRDKVPGAIERYFDQYVYDTVGAVDAAFNSQVAKELDLKYFLYAGSLIKTSRKFCRKRAGKVFSTEEVEKWKDDPDLIDKKTKDSYRPLIERGRYRCRHYIKYITEGLHKRLKEYA